MCRLRLLPALRLYLIGPGVDAAEFVDAGVAQLRQRGGGGLTAVSAAAVDQHRGILLRDHLGGGRFVNGTHRQQHSAGDVAAVVLVLLTHIQNDDLLGKMCIRDSHLAADLQEEMHIQKFE